MVCFIEEEAEVGEYDPQFLPPVAVLELPQQIATQLVLKHTVTPSTNTNLWWEPNPPVTEYFTVHLSNFCQI